MPARSTLTPVWLPRCPQPSRPSTKLSTADGLPTLAANRGTEPARLTRLVRGELDWIVMRALEKDRSGRYESANGFAADVQRYLAGEAVPPSPAYRFRKFARRNKGPVVAATAVLLTLLGGIAGTAVGLVRAEQAREADAQRADAEGRARREAEEGEAETRAMLARVEQGILAARLAEPGPLLGVGAQKARPHRAIEHGLPSAERFNDRPLIEARLRLHLAGAFETLSDPTLPCSRSRGLGARRGAPRTHPDTLGAIAHLARLYQVLGRLPDALKLLVARWERLRDHLGPDHPDSLAAGVIPDRVDCLP